MVKRRSVDAVNYSPRFPRNGSCPVLRLGIDNYDFLRLCWLLKEHAEQHSYDVLRVQRWNHNRIIRRILLMHVLQKSFLKQPVMTHSLRR